MQVRYLACTIECLLYIQLSWTNEQVICVPSSCLPDDYSILCYTTEYLFVNHTTE
uniref:Uncharacterized protein n=1 Tax=Arundo donax TaxID=35708 RepID=A0A0A8ZZF9_ARUDO